MPGVDVARAAMAAAETVTMATRMDREMQDDLRHGEFRLDDWLVQPSLNRLSRAEHSVQVEPKMMDVLVFLASHPGEVVSKNDINDAVWSEVFITESVITRAIAGLRRALTDDARAPRFIETISKRGYRLLVPPATAPSRSAPPAAQWSPPVARSSTPFVIGQWVRGDAFYGRRAVLDELLLGNRNCLWLLGTRRVGKTSVLKQLELIADSSPELGFVPLFWDLQGAAEPDDLHLDFHDALLDAEERLERWRIPVDELAGDDLFQALDQLRRRLRAAGRTLLLLVDEVEELLHLQHADPAMLRKLRRALQSRDGIRSVLASSSRLWELAAAQEHTSPFLDGVAPPVVVGALGDRAACDLICQSQLAPAVQPGFDAATAAAIARHSGNHPYLAQMLAKRCFELGDVEAAAAQLAAEPSLSFLFGVDLSLLRPQEGELLHAAAMTGFAGRAALGADQQPVADHLIRLGLLREDRHGLRPASTFLTTWLRAQ